MVMQMRIPMSFAVFVGFAYLLAKKPLGVLAMAMPIYQFEYGI